MALMQTVSLIVFLACALADWVAVAQQHTRLEYVAKPATLAALLLFATTGTHPSGWLVAALTFSLLGDVYLMLPVDVFAAGLGAFLLAHLAYIADFDAAWSVRLPWLIAILVASYPLTARILRAVTASSLRPAIVGYMTVISLMVASALASGSLLASIGALLFFASDGILAWNRFVTPLRNGRLAVIVTYHLGQLALVTALRSG